MALTTLILDAGNGRPVADICVRLEGGGPGGWNTVCETATDRAGRVDRWSAAPLTVGGYRLTVHAGRFYSTLGVLTAQTEITVSLVLRSVAEAHHLLVLLSPFSCSTFVEVGR